MVLDYNKTDIIIIGGGGHSKTVIDIVFQTNEFNIIGIIDTEDKVGLKVLGVPIIGTDKDLDFYVKKFKNFHIAIGHIKSNRIRLKLFDKIKDLGGEFPVIKAKSSYVSPYAKIGEGTLVSNNVIVNPGAKVGYNCILNSGSLIEHDSSIGNNSHISTMATVNADCIIGDNCFLSSHSVINRGIQLFNGISVFSGSVVTKSFFTENSMLKGIPAKIVG